MRNLILVIAYISLMLLSTLVVADDAKQIDKKVWQQTCGASDCTVTMHREKSYKNYSLRSYYIGGTESGSATALVLMNNKDMTLLKVFNGLSAYDEVMQANIRTLGNAEYLEIYEMTSKGNGEIELYKLDGAKLSLVFNARGVDWHDDGSYYDNGILNAIYPDINGDGHFDIVLDGTVLITNDKTDNITARKECRRVFIWDSSSSKFVETDNEEINPSLCAEFK